MPVHSIFLNPACKLNCKCLYSLQLQKQWEEACILSELGSCDTEQMRTHKTPVSILEAVGLLSEGEHNSGVCHQTGNC